MTTRKELIEAVGARYRSSPRSARKKNPGEFVALTGCHRKHAIRTLRPEPAGEHEAAARNRVYDEAVRQALIMLWEAGDRVCGKRLEALLPVLIDAMEWHGHLELNPTVKDKRLAVSAATIDRMLAETRAKIDGQRKRRKGIGAAIRRSIPVRTFADWRDPPPGFFEKDMVEHYNGPKIDGDYVHTLVLTDIASGWTVGGDNVRVRSSDKHDGRRVASRRNVTRRLVVVSVLLVLHFTGRRLWACGRRPRRWATPAAQRRVVHGRSRCAVGASSTCP